MKRADSGVRVTKEVRDDFMAQKPANITSSQYIRLLLLLWAEKKRAQIASILGGPVRIKGDPELVSYGGVMFGPDTEEYRAIIGKVTGNCLGRPKGAKDLKPRKPRRKKLTLEVR